MGLPGRSITLRLTLLFASVTSAALLALGVLVVSLVERHFEEMDAELLEGKLELVGHALADAHSPEDLRALPTRIESALVGHHGLTVAIWKSDGKVFYASAPTVFPPELRSAQPVPTHPPLKWSTADGTPARGIAGLARTNIPGEAAYTVAVATELTMHEHFMHSFRIALWLAIALAAALTSLMGWLVARGGLAPLRAIARDAAGITASRLDRRLPADSFPTELAEVAETLNRMLARLEESFRRLSDFSSDIAHELRTPVNNLLTQTQVTLSKARAADAYQDVLASNAEELERLSRTIGDMLFLAKSDNLLIVPHREHVDLAKEAQELFDYYEALADEKQVSLNLSGQAELLGDRLMLRRALGNLLSNALRHTPPGGWIAVRLDATAAATTVAVANSGAAIPAEHLPRLFDRFYRVDPSRQHAGKGAGLGLAITQSITRAHGGTAAVKSDATETVFLLRFPSAEASSDAAALRGQFETT